MPEYAEYVAPAPEQEPKKRSLFGEIIETIVIFAVAFLIIWLLKLFVVEPFTIPTGSMEPTIEIGDYVFAEKVSYYFDDVQPGQIVTFADPDGTDQTLIKRCIAVGGQTVDLRNGQVFVDGVALDEPYVYGKLTTPLPVTLNNMDIDYPYTVPEGYIWVMGDNRTNSADSRYFGAIPEDSVSGHAFFTYWPFSSFGKLE